MANLTNNTCSVDEYYINLGIKATYFQQFYTTPVYMCLGIIGHSLCLLPFIKQCKQEKAYVYQIILSCSEIIAITVHGFSQLFSAFRTDRSFVVIPYYSSCYVCILIETTFRFVDSSLTTLTLLFSICMAFDRLCALWKKSAYKPTTRTGYVLIVLVCFILAFSTSVFSIFTSEITIVTGTSPSMPVYFNGLSPFYYTTMRNLMSMAREAFRMTLLSALCFFNISIPYMYRKRLKQTKNAMSTELEIKRRQTLNTLTILSLTECICMSVSTSVVAFSYMYNFMITACTFSNRKAFVFAVVEMIMQFASVADIGFLFMISPSFRKLVLDSVLCLESCLRQDATSTLVVPIQIQNGNRDIRDGKKSETGQANQ